MQENSLGFSWQSFKGNPKKIALELKFLAMMIRESLMIMGNCDDAVYRED
ncbi:MAG: hypothetical protein J1E31_01360 [Helicobacter sp.]|nr:hypothetical protein [Helicobacter sp.]